MATDVRPPESILRKISKVFLPLWGIRAGLYITAQVLFRKKFTVQYPEQQIEIDESYRGKISLLYEPGTGADICISCKQCENICPVNCIHIIARVGEDKKRKVGTFDVDLTKCLFCGMCEEICPEYCIVLDPIYDYSTYSRDGLYVTVEGLRRDASDDEWKQMKAVKDAKKAAMEAKKAAKAAEAAKKAAEENIEENKKEDGKEEG